MGAKQTSPMRASTSENDPEQTFPSESEPGSLLHIS
jgi:hypothetical protein